MKRIVSIAFLSLALLALTVMSFVPHHHHMEVFCTVMELCEADNTCNDRHTAHDTTGENEPGECVVHASYIPAHIRTGVVAPDAQPALQATATTLPEPEASCRQAEYGIYIIAYKSVPPITCGGLRAPPVLS